MIIGNELEQKVFEKDHIDRVVDELTKGFETYFESFRHEPLNAMFAEYISEHQNEQDAYAEYYWEHLVMLDRLDYARDWQKKLATYETHFPGQLITTQESRTLSQETKDLVASTFNVEPIAEENE
ncbi:MAG: hypothetical protein WCY93_11140 [Anaerolineaceae bacterium]